MIAPVGIAGQSAVAGRGVAVTQHPRGDPRFGPPAYSALNLRLVLAVFGALFGTAGAVLAAASGLPAVVVAAFAAFAAIAVANAAFVQHRRRARAEGGAHHSLFE